MKSITNNQLMEYKEIDGIWFEEDTDERFAKFCIEAMHSRRRVRINYNPGWEDYSGYHGGDGLHHTMYIGKSTGGKPCLLSIANSRSLGGPTLLTCKKAIKNYGWK